MGRVEAAFFSVDAIYWYRRAWTSFRRHVRFHEVALVGADGEDWAGRTANDSLRRAPEEELSETAAAVRADDDEIGLDLAGVRQEGSAWLHVANDDRPDIDGSHLVGRDECAERSPGFLVDAFLRATEVHGGHAKRGNRSGGDVVGDVHHVEARSERPREFDPVLQRPRGGIAKVGCYHDVLR